MFDQKSFKNGLNVKFQKSLEFVSNRISGETFLFCSVKEQHQNPLGAS